MLKEERQALILNKLHSSGKVVVSRLAVELGVSEDTIRREKRSADIYLELHAGEEDHTYDKMIARWSSMITSFEIAFGVGYFKQY